MTLPKYPKKKAVAKTGAGYARMVVETSNSIFTEIPQDNDLGIDAIIELVRDEYPTGHCVAVQIKSGASFYSKGTDECKIPVSNHAEYWKKYPLPVFGIVFVPAKQCGYWVDIKEYLKQCQNTTTIKFRCDKLNIFDIDNFGQFFLPYATGEVPTCSFEKAWELFHSPNSNELQVGMIVLFRRYADRYSVWDGLIRCFKEKDFEDIPERLIYFLAHIPGHLDIGWSKPTLTNESREYARTLINSFDKLDVIKLLHFIEKSGVDRGTIGQSAEAIILSIPKVREHLIGITQDEDAPLSTREWASVLLTYRRSWR